MSAQIPGFTEEQAYVLDTIAEKAARRVVAEMKGGGCPFGCSDMDEVKDTLYGKDGIKGRVITLEEQASNLVWWNRAVIVAAVGAIGAVIVQLAT